MHQGGHNHLHAMVSLVATAVSLGGDAQVFLTHAALHAWLQDDLSLLPVQTGSQAYDAFYQAALDAERLPDLRALFRQAQEKGGVRIFACQASVALWRAYSQEQLESLDAIVGHSTFLQLAADRQLVFI